MNNWRQIFSWSEVDSDSYVGWLVKVLLPNEDYYYKVITHETEEYISGTTSYCEENAIEQYDGGNTEKEGHTVLSPSVTIYRIRKIF